MMIWALRCRHSRGFGVQSPWAYSFIRYVVNEHYPYYAYKSMGSRFPGISPLSHKLSMLYFRLANHLQPRWVVDCGSSSEMFAGYVGAGCRRAEIVVVDCGKGAGEVAALAGRLPSADMARFAPSAGCMECYRAVLAKATPSSMFVIEGIHTTREGRRFWAEVLRDGATGVTFDLYYCGIVCFDKNRYKQNYIVNF